MKHKFFLPFYGVILFYIVLIGTSHAAIPVAELEKYVSEDADSAWRPLAVDLAPAKWIWLPSGRTLNNTFVLFRRDVSLDTPVKKATGWITADSRYLLTVNGQRVQWGPAPCDPRHYDVDPVDLTPYLKPGKNVIASQVLFYGHGDGTSPTGKPGFLFYLVLEYEDGRKEHIVSDQTWKANLDRGHRPGMYKRWFLRSLQEEFDMRLHPLNWNAPERELSQNEGWANAMVLHGASDKPASSTSYAGNDLMERVDPAKSSLRIREIPLIQELEIPVTKLTEQGTVDWHRDPQDWFEMRMPNCFTIQTQTVTRESPEGTWLVDAPKNPQQGLFLTFELQEQVVGFPYFTIEAPEGTIVELMAQEAHATGKNLWLDSQFFAWSRFICREGVNRFETFDFESLRWLQLHIRNANGPVKITNVGVRRRMYDWSHEPKIRCSEPELQRLFEASINTLYNSCLDTCVDGMARERQQYSGDGGHQLLAVRSTLGETRLPKRFLRTFSEGQGPDGYFMDSWPAFDRLARIVQKYMDGAYWGPLWDHGVGFNFDCWYHYLETGDMRALDEPYPRLVRFAEYLLAQKSEDGLLPVENLGIPTVWMDHIAYQKQSHKRCAFNLYVAGMLEKALAPIAKARGDVAKSEYFSEQGRLLREKTVAVFWDPDRKTFVNNRPWLKEEKSPRMDDRSLAMAILFGQCPENDTTESVRLLVESPPEMGFSYPCNACWRYWALCRSGRSDVVLKEFRERWAKMDSVVLNNTLAEDWHAAPDSGSQWSHCAVAPLFVTYTDIAGIRPTSPGFKTCEIRPALADMENLELVYHTPLGPIHFSATKTQTGHDIQVTHPENCDVTLIVPENSSGKTFR